MRLHLWSRIHSSRIVKKFTLTKREKFAIITLLLTVGLVATQIVSPEARLKMVFVSFFVTYILAAWGLSDNFGGIEWFTLLILPSFYTAAVSLFYFLLPVRWITRLPVALFYAIGMYALLLTENIFNVAVERSIPLVRVAYAIGLLLSVITVFLILNTIYALRLAPYLNFILILFLLLPITYQQLWVMTLESRISKTLLIYAGSIALAIAEIGLVLSFWPVRGTIAALFLAILFYVSVGMSQQHLIERLFGSTVRLFLLALVFAILILFATTRWG